MTAGMRLGCRVRLLEEDRLTLSAQAAALRLQLETDKQARLHAEVPHALRVCVRAVWGGWMLAGVCVHFDALSSQARPTGDSPVNRAPRARRPSPPRHALARARARHKRPWA